MSARLANALIAQIGADLRAGEPSWMLIEGIDVGLARELLVAWPSDGYPPMRIAAPPPADFGDAALGSATGALGRSAISYPVNF